MCVAPGPCNALGRGREVPGGPESESHVCFTSRIHLPASFLMLRGRKLRLPTGGHFTCMFSILRLCYSGGPRRATWHCVLPYCSLLVNPGCVSIFRSRITRSDSPLGLVASHVISRDLPISHTISKLGDIGRLREVTGDTCRPSMDYQCVCSCS